jgi:hypothetical protein
VSGTDFAFDLELERWTAKGPQQNGGRRLDVFVTEWRRLTANKLTHRGVRARFSPARCQTVLAIQPLPNGRQTNAYIGVGLVEGQCLERFGESAQRPYRRPRKSVEQGLQHVRHIASPDECQKPLWSIKPSILARRYGDLICVSWAKTTPPTQRSPFVISLKGNFTIGRHRYLASAPHRSTAPVQSAT